MIEFFWEVAKELVFGSSPKTMAQMIADVVCCRRRSSSSPIVPETVYFTSPEPTKKLKAHLYEGCRKGIKANDATPFEFKVCGHCVKDLKKELEAEMNRERQRARRQ